MKTMLCTAGLVLIFALGCSPLLSGPDVDQVKKDLVGQSFDFRDDRYKVKVVQDVVIQERFSDKDAKTEDLFALVNLTGEGLVGDVKTFQAVLVVRYKHFEQGWKVQSVSLK